MAAEAGAPYEQASSPLLLSCSEIEIVRWYCCESKNDTRINIIYNDSTLNSISSVGILVLSTVGL